MSIRFYHLASHHWSAYVHDGASHAAYVGYVRVHLRLPPVDDDFEYPQQPLYYLLAAPFYNTHQNWDQNWDNLAPLGFCISAASLTLVFLSLRYLSSWLLRYGIFVFLAFTPAFVLASSCIGNDGLGFFFGAFCFYCILRLNRSPGTARHFIMAIGALLGALLTKLNGIVLLLALPWLLWRRARFDSSWKPTVTRLAVVVLLVTLWACGVLYRGWNPGSRQFVFAHAWMWDAMKINENRLVFWLRFDLSNLILAGQTTTTAGTPDEVRFSFPSWEYGNMLLGEYGYADDPVLLFCTRQVIVAGTYLLFGLAFFIFITLLSRPIWPWQNIFSLSRTVLLLIVGSTCLVLAFVYSDPVMCNADFRYQNFALPWIGYGIGRGLCAFPRSSVWRYTMVGFMVLYVYASLCLLTALYIRR
ncbi:MAG: hypothetical protein LV481_08790 [Methylacidiphilales bacterium]|nr:hypothetical protein [Candidatus Methylacidiphilales bacterium]